MFEMEIDDVAGVLCGQRQPPSCAPLLAIPVAVDAADGDAADAVPGDSCKRAAIFIICVSFTAFAFIIVDDDGGWSSAAVVIILFLSLS